MPRKYESMQERIIANSVPSDEHAWANERCWVWIAKSKANRAGVHYPVVSVREGGKVKAKLAHRVSVEAFTGVPLAPGHVAKHLCNNTLCVNPAHLEGGTQSQNMRQAVAEGRDWYSKEQSAEPSRIVFYTSSCDAFAMTDSDRRFFAFPEEWYEGRSAL